MDEIKFRKTFEELLIQVLNNPGRRRNLHYLIHKKEKEDAWFKRAWKGANKKC